MHAETDSQARASLRKPLVFHLRYASQVQQIRSQQLNQGNCRAFNLIRGSIITLAHSDQPYTQILWEIHKNPDSTNSSMSRRCGSSKPAPTPLNGEARKRTRYAKKRERKEALRGRKKSSTKAIAMPTATGGRAREFHGKTKREYQKREGKQRGIRQEPPKPSPQLWERVLCHK